MVREIAAAFVLFAGAAFATIGALGILRAKNNFAALHAAGAATLLLAPLALAAVVIATGFGMSSAGMLVLFAIVVFGGPIVSHALGIAEHRRNPRA